MDGCTGRIMRKQRMGRRSGEEKLERVARVWTNGKDEVDGEDMHGDRGTRGGRREKEEVTRGRREG